MFIVMVIIGAEVFFTKLFKDVCVGKAPDARNALRICIVHILKQKCQDNTMMLFQGFGFRWGGGGWSVE